MLPGCIEDINNLPTHELRFAAVSILIDIEHGDIVGRPLEDRRSIGDLSDCYKIYFDTAPHVRPRYRLVYRKNPKGHITGVNIEAVAVGERAQLQAYRLAAHRLGRVSAGEDNESPGTR